MTSNCTDQHQIRRRDLPVLTSKFKDLHSQNYPLFRERFTPDLGGPNKCHFTQLVCVGGQWHPLFLLPLFEWTGWGIIHRRISILIVWISGWRPYWSRGRYPELQSCVVVAYIQLWSVLRVPLGKLGPLSPSFIHKVVMETFLIKVTPEQLEVGR